MGLWRLRDRSALWSVLLRLQPATPLHGARLLAPLLPQLAWRSSLGQSMLTGWLCCQQQPQARPAVLTE